MVAIKQVIEAYVARGFKIWHIYADGQFEHAGKHIKNMNNAEHATTNMSQK